MASVNRPWSVAFIAAYFVGWLPEDTADAWRSRTLFHAVCVDHAAGFGPHSRITGAVFH